MKLVRKVYNKTLRFKQEFGAKKNTHFSCEIIGGSFSFEFLNPWFCKLNKKDSIYEFWKDLDVGMLQISLGYTTQTDYSFQLFYEDMKDKFYSNIQIINLNDRAILKRGEFFEVENTLLSQWWIYENKSYCHISYTCGAQNDNDYSSFPEDEILKVLDTISFKFD